MPDCAAHVALAAVTAAAWLGLGTVLLAPLRGGGNGALGLANRFGAGAAGFALLTFGLALLGLAERALVVPLLVAAALVGLAAAARAAPALRAVRPREWPRWQLALTALVAAYVAVELVITCAPVSSADALLHHLAAPEQYARTGAFEELPWSWNSYQPYGVEMLILDGILLNGAEQGAFAPLLLGLGALGATAGAAHRLGGRTAAVLAAAVLWAQPFTAWIATSTFVEPGTALFVALAAWNLGAFAERGGAAPLALAGTFGGAAAGTKYFGAAAAAVLFAAGAVLLRRHLTPARVALVALPALAVAAPWYVKNAVYTGDPVYPLLRGWPNEEARRTALESIEGYGHGTSPLDALLLPLRLLADADEFDRGEFMSPLLLLFAPVALLVPRLRRPVAVALAGCALFVGLWFLGVQHARFLFGAFPVLAVLAALGIAALERAGRPARVATVAVCAGALAAGAAITAVYAAQLLPVAVGLESRERFLRENTPYYDGIAWLDENLPADARVALGHVLVAHSERPAIAWTADALPSTAGPAETSAFVERYDLTHAQVFEGSAQQRQLEAVGARELARVRVRNVTSRTLSELGPPETMVVYELPR